MRWWQYAILVTLGFILFSKMAPYDDTDPPGGRSGMGLRTDNLTGCQYLMSPSGNLTPRMADDGKTHLGCRGN